MNPKFSKKQLHRWWKLILSISLFTITTIITLQSTTTANQANIQLEEWQFFPEYNQLEFTLSSPSQPKYFYLPQPPRLVVDLPNTKLGRLSNQQNYSGVIQKVRLSQLNANVTRIVMDLAPGTNFDPKLVQFQQVPWQKPNHWALRIFPGNYSSAQTNTYPNNFPQVNNQPVSPNIYPPQLPGNNQPQIYPPQLPGNNQPQIYSPQLPGNNQLPIYPSPQPTNNQQPIYPPQPNNPQANNNYPMGTFPQVPNNNFPSYPTPNPYGNQQPTVTVPPLAPNNSLPSPGNSQLPPANFPNPSGGFINSPPPNNSNFPTTNSNPINNPNSGVIEWGQTIPNQR
jgi:AMIN domain